MMKKLLSLILGLTTFSLFAQLPVSTTPENKNVVLEEFTGIHCVYCPQGHAIAKAVQDANPNDVVLINIHTGSYATPSAGEPDFRTSFGTAIETQSQLTGYPAGTVNRHVFPSPAPMTAGGTAMGRGSWTASAASILALPSYVNVALEASVDVITRVLTVNVQAYYTGTSTQATNKLNVGILQNNILGPQTGGNAGNLYNHMHMLKHLITGQWGETLDTTTTGKLYTRTYTYTVPASYTSVPCDISNLEIFAFITETQQEVMTGARCFPTYTGITNTTDAALLSSTVPPSVCGTQVAPTIKLRNMGMNPMTAATIEYKVNGGTVSIYNWSGSLTSYQSAGVTLPLITFTPQASNTLDVTITQVNGSTDQNVVDNTSSATFVKSPVGIGSSFNFELKCDNYGSETTWKLKNSAGTVLYQGGPYADATNPPAINQTFVLTTLDCYTLEMYDAYGDGINAGYGVGYYKLKNLADNSVLINGSNFISDKAIDPLQVTVINGLDENTNDQINVYPNPASDIVNITNATYSDIMLYDVYGKLIMADQHISSNYSLDVSKVAIGSYILKVLNKEKTSSIKINVVR